MLGGCLRLLPQPRELADRGKIIYSCEAKRASVTAAVGKCRSGREVIYMFDALPRSGRPLAGVRGDYVGRTRRSTSSRFHVIALPLVLAAWSGHIRALHEVGLEQSRWGGDQEYLGQDGHPVAVPSTVLHGEGYLASCGPCISRSYVLRAGVRRYFSSTTTYPGRPAEAPSHIAPVWYSPSTTDLARHGRIHVRARDRGRGYAILILRVLPRRTVSGVV